MPFDLFDHIFFRGHLFLSCASIKSFFLFSSSLSFSQLFLIVFCAFTRKSMLSFLKSSPISLVYSGTSPNSMSDSLLSSKRASSILVHSPAINSCSLTFWFHLAAFSFYFKLIYLIYFTKIHISASLQKLSIVFIFNLSTSFSFDVFFISFYFSRSLTFSLSCSIVSFWCFIWFR